MSHNNAVSHSALGVSGHVCEHTPTLCAQCTHSGLVHACSVSDSSEIIVSNSTNVGIAKQIKPRGGNLSLPGVALLMIGSDSQINKIFQLILILPSIF